MYRVHTTQCICTCTCTCDSLPHSSPAHLDHCAEDPSTHVAALAFCRLLTHSLTHSPFSPALLCLDGTFLHPNAPPSTTILWLSACLILTRQSRRSPRHSSTSHRTSLDCASVARFDSSHPNYSAKSRLYSAAAAKRAPPINSRKELVLYSFRRGPKSAARNSARGVAG